MTWLRIVALGLCFAVAARADVLDVPSEFPTIAAAIAESQPGDEIVLAPGTYNDPVSFEGQSDLVLRGKGKVVLGGGTAMQATVTITNHASKITLDHLRIEGSQGNGVFAVECNDVTLRRVVIANVAGIGVVTGEATGTVLDRCRIEGTGGHGVDAGEATQLLLTRCTILGAGESGIHFEEVDSSTIERCRIEASAVRGMSLGLGDLVTECVVRDNVVLGTGEAGILLRGPRNVAVGNVVKGAGGVGLYFRLSSTDGLSTDNRLIGCNVGMQVEGDGLVAFGDRVIKSVTDGIVVTGDDCTLGEARAQACGNDGVAIGPIADNASVVGCRAVKAGGDGFEVGGSAAHLTANVSTGATQAGFDLLGTTSVLIGNASKGSGFAEFVDDGSGTILVDNDFGEP